MKMYFDGTKPIDVHPSKVSEMERKGWSITPPEQVDSKSKSSKKGKKNGSS